jgi:hypothetical protein
MAFLRNFLLKNLITFKITQEAAAANHLTVSPAKVAQASGGEPLPLSMSEKDRELLRQFFIDSARSELEQAVIGAHLEDGSVTNADGITSKNVNKYVSESAKYLTPFTRKVDVTVNPAYGTWNGTTLVDDEGSLSAPASRVAKNWIALRKANGTSVAGLPPSQVCG